MVEIGLERAGARASPTPCDEADGGRRATSGCPSSSGRPSSSAAGAPASPSTPRSSAGSPPTGSTPARSREILIERSIAGWKEFELEVMRDRADNCVVVCSIENLDPMGVHTGDSITVAPAQTLSRRRVPGACATPPSPASAGSASRPAAPTCSSPSTRRPASMVIIEMNPRVSAARAALASKATGFPIAKIAARLAVGYTLDEIPNDITRQTPASFEPTIDYVVTKIPRWAFEKLPGTDRRARHPDAVGRRGHGHRPHLPRVAARRRCARSSRAGSGLNGDPAEAAVRRARPTTSCWPRRAVATPERLFQLEAAAAPGRRASSELHEAHRHRPVVPRPDAAPSPRSGRTSPSVGLDGHDPAATGGGPSGSASPTPSSAYLWGVDEADVRAARLAAGVRATFKTVDTCAAEFEADDAVPLLDLRGRGRGAAVATGPRSSSSARARTASARASSSTTAACTPASPCATPATRRSWSTATPRRSRPTTTPATASTSSRSPTRTSLNVIEAEQAAGGGRRRHRGARRPDAAQAGRPAARPSWCSARARRRSTWPRTASAGTRCAPGSRSPSRRAAPPPTSTRRWPSPSGSATRCWCGRATCSAAGPWRSSTTTTSWPRPWPQLAGVRLARAGGRPVGRAAGAGRPLPGGRHRGRRRRHPRRHRRGAHRRGHGARRGGRRALGRLAPACSRRRRCRAETVERASRRYTRRHRRRARRARASSTCSTR